MQLWDEHDNDIVRRQEWVDNYLTDIKEWMSADEISRRRHNAIIFLRHINTLYREQLQRLKAQWIDDHKRRNADNDNNA